MKRLLSLSPFSRSIPLVAAIGLMASMLIGGGDASASLGQVTLHPLSQLSPFEAPSGAGERLLLERAGYLPKLNIPPDRRPHRAPVIPSQNDVIVNDPADDTPERTTQSETSLAVLEDTICAGYNNSGPGGLSGLSRSSNLGTTWVDLGGIGQSGDPSLAVREATGAFYYAELATIGGNPAIGVAASTDDCLNFGAPVDAAAGSSGLMGTILSDKPWIGIDNTGGANDGNIYACWTRFIDTDNDGRADDSELRFSRSLDGGGTFQSEQILSPTGTGPFGCTVGVGPGGQVYVAWADRAGANQNDIRFRSSVDAGVTFAAAVSISTGNRHPGVDAMVACDVNRPTLTGDIRMLHQAWMAVDATGGPFDGNIYVVWASDPTGTPDNSDAFVSRSTNGGVTWSAPVQLGAGGGATDQFEPFVAVAGAGAVSMAWYDRRNDPTNNTLIDVYKTFSQDGGGTIDPIGRVSDVNFPVPPINPNFDPAIVDCYMGEYIGVAGDARNFYYLWGDNRNVLVTPNFPGGRPDPDVFFESEPAPVVNDADLSIAKSDNPDPAVAGEQLSYDLEASNAGPDIALDVVVTDTLPSGVTYASDTAGCDTSAIPTLTCNVGDLASGGSISLSITVDIDADLVFNSGGPTTITNTASVSGVANDPDPSNNNDSEDTLVVAEADLQIVSFEAVDPPVEILIGDELEVTLRKVITNSGPSAPMDVELTKTAAASPGATVEPTFAVEIQPALDLAELRQVDEVFTISCQEPGPHTFVFTNEIQPADPADTDPNQSNNTATESFDVVCVVRVAINIKPGSFPNSINLKSKGNIPVAVLTTEAGEYGLPFAFDATRIDPLTVRFGPPEVIGSGGGALESHGRGHIEDAYELDEITLDGDLDMVLHFPTEDTGLESSDTEACVKGKWIGTSGERFLFFGCDSVRIMQP